MVNYCSLKKTRRRRINTINVSIAVVETQSGKTLDVAEEEVGGSGEVEEMVEYNGTKAT